MEVNVNEIKKEFEERQLLEVHRKLTLSRRYRRLILGHLLTALIFTVIYGTVENPFQYTLSKMGNIFTVSHRMFFIVWGVYVGFTFFVTMYVLHRLEKYDRKNELTTVFLAGVFLILTVLIPSMPSLPVSTIIHIITAMLFSLLLAVGTLPFFLFVARENPRLKKTIHVWIGITFIGGTIWALLYGNKGIYELWFISMYLILTLYVSMMLFEESIIKYCVEILRDEEDLNIGIEKAYVEFEETEEEMDLESV